MAFTKFGKLRATPYFLFGKSGAERDLFESDTLRRNVEHPPVIGYEETSDLERSECFCGWCVSPVNRTLHENNISIFHLCGKSANRIIVYLKLVENQLPVLPAPAEVRRCPVS